MLPKKRRLTTALFDQVFKSGKVQHGEYFWVRSLVLPAPISTLKSPNVSKFAVAVSKKVAPTAVARNAIKRKIYETIKKTVSIDQTGLGVIVGVKKDISSLSSAQFETDLSVLLKKVLK